MVYPKCSTKPHLPGSYRFVDWRVCLEGGDRGREGAREGSRLVIRGYNHSTQIDLPFHSTSSERRALKFLQVATAQK